MPDIQATTPDGVIHSFPDGTPDDVVDKAIKGYLAGAAVPTEKSAAAHPLLEPPPKPPGVLGRPAMPGTSRRGAPVSTDPRSKLTPEMQASRSIPFEVAKGTVPAVVTAVAPEAVFPGAVASTIGRGAGALAGASYGGGKARELGLPKWTGQAVGGAVGLFAPEVIGKLSGPIISRIATILGKSAPEIATVIAEDSTLASKVGRDVVERAARGAPLTEKEEQILFDQVQKHYTPEAGVETSAQKAGKIYAGRGTSLRPTNEQLALQKSTGLAPPPSPEPITAEPVSAPAPKSAPTPSQGKRFTDKPLSEYAGAKGTAGSDQLTDLIVKRTGMDRRLADAQAESLIKRAKSGNRIEAEQANRYINELFASERRARR